MVIIKSTPETLKAIMEKLPDLPLKDGGSCLAFPETSDNLRDRLIDLQLTSDVLLEIYEKGEAKKETIPGAKEPVHEEPDPVIQSEMPDSQDKPEGPLNSEETDKAEVTEESEKEPAMVPDEAPTDEQEKPFNEESTEKGSAPAVNEANKNPKKITFTDAPAKRKLPPILPVPPTNYSFEDANRKLAEDKTRLTDNAADSLWTIEALSERCKEDHDFVQYVMREGKTFIGAYNYVADLAYKKLVGTRVENIKSCPMMVDLSKENALPYFVEYFMLDDDEIARRKKKKADKEKAELEAKNAAKKAEKQKGKKKKATPVSMPKNDLLKGIEIPKAEVPVEQKAEPQPVKKPETAVKEPENAIKGEQLDMFSLVGFAV